MPEETPVDTPIEETPIEETPVEETPVVDNSQELVTLPFNITNTRENLEIIARSRGYQDRIRRPDTEPGMPLEVMLMDNPQDAIAWLNDHIKDFLADVASRPFIDATARAKQEEIETEKQRIRQIARGSIS